MSLIASDEPTAFEIMRENGDSAFFLTCDHGGNQLPRALQKGGANCGT